MKIFLMSISLLYNIWITKLMKEDKKLNRKILKFKIIKK